MECQLKEHNKEDGDDKYGKGEDCGGKDRDKERQDEDNDTKDGHKDRKDNNETEESEPKSSDESDISLGSWEYVEEEGVHLNTLSMYQSQPCFNKRGVSYTPPGWVRKYKKRTKKTMPLPCAKIKMD